MYAKFSISYASCVSICHPRLNAAKHDLISTQEIRKRNGKTGPILKPSAWKIFNLYKKKKSFSISKNFPFQLFFNRFPFPSQKINRQAFK